MRLKRQDVPPPEVNMVPMIDCVFQLIIFFLVAMQVKQNETTPLQLPVSRMATEVKTESEVPFIVNVLNPDAANGKPYVALGEMFDLGGFKQFMRGRRDFYRNAGKSMPVLRVRADKDSRLKDIQELLIACRDVEIWQVKLATLKRQ